MNPSPPSLLSHKFIVPFLSAAILLTTDCCLSAQTPETKEILPVPVPLGAGSYAARPPQYLAARPDQRGGITDLSQVMTHMKLWVTAAARRDNIPSTDWWTSLVTMRYSGQLWAYPGMVHAEPSGVFIQFPKTWKLADNKKTMEMVSASGLHVRGAGFQPESAEAESWSDWLVSFRMTDSKNKAAWIRTTIGHGLPFTWIESNGVDLRVDCDAPVLFNDSGMPIRLPVVSDHVGVETAKDCYGLFAPPGTQFYMDGASIAVRFKVRPAWLAVGVMQARQHLPFFAKYSPVIPRDTKVEWKYDAKAGEVATTWTLTTENLDGGAERDVIQGWIPHHYNTKRGAKLDFEMIPLKYATPRGELRCAVGHRFGITYPFRGLLPELPAPKVVANQPNPFRPEVMRSLVEGYTSVTGYGSETYWGGKKILLYAKYMEMARQLGMDKEYIIFKTKLTEALTDWCNYEPGKPEHFFGMYPNWGSFLGFKTRDNGLPGIDILQDHAFCYGYHVYAAALLINQDPDFAADYGEFYKLLVKDYANWDRNDKRFCTFRAMDPWCGHSWSGGLGDEHGNGMESSSESMQAWGAMFLLGEALGDTTMRDAAIFGYTCESRAVMEYWFDRDKTNIPRDIWPHEYNSNCQTNGIGWWTWFSGDNYWMHAIQWLPMSPLLKYLYEDPAFAKWDYDTMWASKSVTGWDDKLGNEAGLGNVTLSFLQIFDPDQAAAIFDKLWDANKGTAHEKDESGPTYYRIQSGRALGKIRWDAWCDIPTSTVYKDERTERTTVVVYNLSNEVKPCNYYDNGRLAATFGVPPHRLITYGLDSKPAALAIDALVKTIEPGKPLPLQERITDQYGALVNAPVRWIAPAGTSIDAGGIFQATAKGEYIVAASVGGLSAQFKVRCDAAPIAKQIKITPAKPVVETGTRTRFKAVCLDQYGDEMPGKFTWKASGGGVVDASGGFRAGTPGTSYLITASGNGIEATEPLNVVPSLAAYASASAANSAPALSSILVEPPTALIWDNATQQFTATGYDQFGNKLPIQVNWRVEGRGSINAKGEYTPAGGNVCREPSFNVIAEAGGLKWKAHVVVEEIRKVRSLKVSPGGGSVVQLAQGGELQCSAECADQFEARFDLPVRWSAKGNLRIDPNGKAVATAVGDGQIIAEAGDAKAVIPVKIVRPEDVNLATRCPVQASSVENDGLRAEFAIDGDPRTRWASAWSEPQWFMVDLQKSYALKQVVLSWEAFPKEYRVELSSDGSTWRTVASKNDGKGRTETFDLMGARGRYLRIYITKRAGGYGVSLFEVEAYGTP